MNPSSKVPQLDQLHPQLTQQEPAPGPTSTIGTPIEHLDLATVINVSQAVAGEIILEKLLDTVLRTAIQHAGAERGLLILPRGADQRIAAEVTTNSNAIIVQLCDQRLSAAVLPESVLHYVLRTQESVTLDDAAAARDPFSADPYIRQHHARSILCLPLLNRAKLIGVLYLENNLSSHVFVPARIAVLKHLASQAAISLENIRLLTELQEREEKVRGLVDSALDAVLIIDEQGRITEWNKPAETMFGWRREEAVGQRLSEMTIPMPYRSHHEEGLRRFLTSGEGPLLNRLVEITAVRRDGGEFPIELWIAPYRVGGTWAFSGFVRDISERKRAEAAARESERRYREGQMVLAHANRVATMGQLTASIAHEVSQPISAAITNANVALHWLDAEHRDLEKVRLALDRTVKSGNRASAVVDRIRAFVKKEPPRTDSVEINEAILEVVALTRSETAKSGVSVHMQLAEGLPLIHGDRVQLLQVMLNLIINAVEAMSDLGEGLRELLITTTKAESDGVLVAVRDSGPGLAPVSLKVAFEAFYTTKPGGLGIGLSICRSIIEAHGGRLWATASEPRGATFMFTLPEHPDSAVIGT